MKEDGMSDTGVLHGKIAVVTGGSRGLGLFIARALASAGAKVVITGRRKESLDEAVRRSGGSLAAEVCDHTNEESVAALARKVVAAHGPPDILVNNAGMWEGGMPVATMPTESWRRILDTNLNGAFFTTHAFLPPMIERGRGDIVIIGSTSSLRADAGSSAYAASKFGLRGFTEALTKEVRKNGIRVTFLSPSDIDKSDPPRGESGKGLSLHAEDLARTVLHIVTLPGRTLIREIEVWGTNP
jgi:3-oxoacyl-[acyl-carrier protein] reductase